MAGAGPVDLPTSAAWRRGGGVSPLHPGGPSLRKVQSAATDLPKRGSGPTIQSQMQPPTPTPAPLLKSVIFLLEITFNFPQE